MKIDFSAKLLNINDEPIQELQPKKQKEDPNVYVHLSLGRACIDAMLSVVESDRGEKEQSKFDRWELAKKIKGNDKDTVFEVEEVALIKKRAGLYFSPGVVGPIYELLEGKGKKK